MGTWDSMVGGRKKFTKEDVERSRERLAGMVKPGDTVHTLLEHVSRSRMSRRIRPLVLRDGDASNLGFSAAAVLGWSVTDQAVHLSGCGMDMGFELVYQLSSALFPDGFGCIGEGCPSNDHPNGDRDYTPHGHRKAVHVPNDPDALRHWHQAGGYALRQRWL